MSGYDRMVSDSKSACTQMLMNLTRQDEAPEKHGRRFTMMDMASAIDELNKAWDALTAALVRQRDTRDAEIRSLLDRLAESKK